jgi:hypothetical protein
MNSVVLKISMIETIGGPTRRPKLSQMERIFNRLILNLLPLMELVLENLPILVAIILAIESTQQSILQHVV